LESSTTDEKIQKVLARAGLGSRREIERWISEGRISVDGHIATLGDRISPHQLIRVDGRRFSQHQLQPQSRALLYYKPEGELCSRTDREGRPTVFDRLPPLKQGRWIAIGRLDINSSGLLLFTTDGDLANRLMHPSYEIEREYAVRVLGTVDDDRIKRLQTGVTLDDGPAHFMSISDAGGEGANHWYHVIIREGRKREVRRLWEAVGCKVSRLIRIRYGPIALPRRMHHGEYLELETQEINKLRYAVGLVSEQSSPARQKQNARRRKKS
jgi:23S rRNA pseudouridine2605 synthase